MKNTNMLNGTSYGVHRRLIVFFFLLLSCYAAVAQVERYPAICQVNTQLNVRSCPSTSCRTLGQIRKWEHVTVLEVEKDGNMLWGLIKYDNRYGYVAMQYVSYITYTPPADNTPKESVHVKSKINKSFATIMEKVLHVVGIILKIVGVILVLAFWQQLLELAIYAGMAAGAGALVGWIVFGNGSVGAIVGLVIAALVGLRMLADYLELDSSWGGVLRLVPLGIYYIVSFPFTMLNRIEHILVAPWRYIFKTGWMSDDVKPALRVISEILTVINHIALTPLRLLNAAYYNILIHCVTGIYDLLFEVLVPSDSDEGAGDTWRWILMLPYRILKYPVWHGFLAVIESVVWTVIDIFVPAITMYHGTDRVAGEAITSDPMRNKYLRNTSTYTYGTFTASSSSWGGIGVYFASRRIVAMSYAHDPHRLNDGNPVVIVCRVSLGRVINYALTTDYIFAQAGQYGKHSELNRFGEQHNYTTGEWWNGGGGYWEYCLFDWQNRYNHPWRIRPIYILNYRTGLAQHIKGGIQHWLFDRASFESLMDDLFG